MRFWLSSMTIHILLVVVKMKSTTERNAMSEQRYPRHAAEGFLRENLPANAKDVEERARAAGIAQRTLARARQMLGVYAQPDGVWRLPGEHEVIDRHAMTKWPHHPNLRKKPHAPSKGRGPVQRAEGPTGAITIYRRSPYGQRRPTHAFSAETEDFNRGLIAWVWHNRKKTKSKSARKGHSTRPKPVRKGKEPARNGHLTLLLRGYKNR